MVTYYELRSSEPGRFEDAAIACADLSKALNRHGRGLGQQSTAISDAWHGSDQVGGTAAVDFVKAQADVVAWSANDLETMSTVLTELATSVEKAKKEASEAERDAIELGAAVSNTGVARTLEPHKRPLAAVITQRIADAVKKATAADNEARARIGGISPGNWNTGPFKALIIPVDSSPVRVKQWWDGLTSEQRQQLLATKPEEIGKLDGIPAEYRDLANRVVFKGQIAAVEDTVAQLELKRTESGLTSVEIAELAAARDRLEGLQRIEKQLDRPTGVGGDDRMYLLGFSNEKDGQAIVSVGNPDTADKVFTFVPGMTSDMENFGAELEKINGMVDDAKKQPGGQNTAGILWLGYDAPDDVGAVLDKQADDGAVAFKKFQEGLRTTHIGQPSTNTAIGHSYGSLLVGKTAVSDTGMDVDQVIFLGSPGVDVDDVTELNIRGDGDSERIWAAITPNDYIDWAPDILHGTEPTAEDFGAKIFTTGELNDAKERAGHTNYLDKSQTTDTGARTNMARIITGNHDKVTMKDDE